MPNRRAFIGQLGAGAMFAALPLTSSGASEFIPRDFSNTSDTWDLSWTDRVTGKYRAVFDVPEIESGYGVWRASVWKNQYVDVLKADPKECSPVLVLRQWHCARHEPEFLGRVYARKEKCREASGHREADGSQSGAALVGS